MRGCTARSPASGTSCARTRTPRSSVVRRYLSYLPSSLAGGAAGAPIRCRHPPAPTSRRSSRPATGRRSTCGAYVRGLLDEGSFFEIHALWAREVVVGFGRLDGEVVGVVANNSLLKGGVLFVDSADKATRFVQLCDAFNVPLLFLADVPGFMVGTEVERQGIIRHGAKMITAVSEATVPKICVVVRKAYGAGLYAMAGPGFDPDATLALPTASIAVMGAEAAVNAVYANKIAAIEDEDERAAFVAARRAEYDEDIDIVRLASELVVDAIVQPSELRDELVRRFAAARGQGPLVQPPPARRHPGLTDGDAGARARPAGAARAVSSSSSRTPGRPSGGTPRTGTACPGRARSRGGDVVGQRGRETEHVVRERQARRPRWPARPR